MGNMAIAKELIDLAKEAKASYVKFQKRNNRELLTQEQYQAPHPVHAQRLWRHLWCASRVS